MRKNLDRFMNKPDTKIVILTLTDRCNLDCVYCYEHHKRVKSMELETALKIVEREMLMDDGTNFTCLYYFGGEPFLEFDMIRRIHQFMKSRSWPKGWFGFSTTNGTLVHDAVQEWLRENASTIEVYLSLDGTPEMHNKNRSGSFDHIDIDFFRREFPFAKMTITEATLPQLAQGVIGLHELGFEVSANLGEGILWPDHCPEILAEQLHILMEYYLAHPELKPATILNLPIRDLNPGAQPPKRFCGVGPLMRSYDTDGQVYPCHAFAPLCIGKEKAEQAKKLDFTCPLLREDLDSKCRDCPIVGECPTCYGINYGAFGNVYRVTEEHCKMMKTLFLANSAFQYRLFASNRLALSKEAELKLLRNILTVQSMQI